MTTTNDGARRRGGVWEGAMGRLDEELPPGRSSWTWAWEGVQTNAPATIAGLLLTWGGLSMLVFFAFWGAIGGGLLGLVGGVFLSLAQTVSPETSQLLGFVMPTVQAAGPIAGAVAGAIGVPAAVYGGTALSPGSLVLSTLSGLFPGILIGGAILWGYVRFEHRLLDLRGARRLSRRERERLEPLFEDVASRYDLGGRKPEMMMYDDVLPQAYAHARHIVFTRGLLELLDDDELAGVIAHEMHHWRKGHAAGSVAVWAAAWPILAVYGVALRVAAYLPPLIAALIFLVTWHVLISVRLIVAPLVGLRSREHEYEADDAAARGGYGEGLYRSIEQVRELEPGRGGWQQALARTHPPVELRLEALEGGDDTGSLGGLLELCPECEAPAVEGQRYCHQCGHELATAARG